MALYPEQRRDHQTSVTIHFRLSNDGNHPVFYAVPPQTNVPLGEIVDPQSALPQWTTLSRTFTSQQQQSVGLAAAHPTLSWIEMPPGGWVDGEFSDPGDLSGDRAYIIFVKPSRNASESPILSQPYQLYGNRN